MVLIVDSFGTAKKKSNVSWLLCRRKKRSAMALRFGRKTFAYDMVVRLRALSRQNLESCTHRLAFDYRYASNVIEYFTIIDYEKMKSLKILIPIAIALDIQEITGPINYKSMFTRGIAVFFRCSITCPNEMSRVRHKPD